MLDLKSARGEVCYTSPCAKSIGNCAGSLWVGARVEKIEEMRLPREPSWVIWEESKMSAYVEMAMTMGVDIICGTGVIWDPTSSPGHPRGCWGIQWASYMVIGLEGFDGRLQGIIKMIIITIDLSFSLAMGRAQVAKML